MIFVIGGTTGSGKSKLAFEFAKKVNGILINGDAFAIYRELNIGSAKPSKDELEGFTNYLFGHVSVTESYSIYDYQKEVRAIFQKYLGKRPLVIVGGSGLYIRAALYDYTFSEIKKYEGDPYETLSNEEVYAKLEKADPHSATLIHSNNRKRVVRALYIAENSDINKSTNEQTQQKNPLFPYTLVVLDRNKDELLERVNERTKNMFERGLRYEAETLIKKYGPKNQALHAIGYKEFVQLKDDQTTISEIVQNTMRYAKRQRTFFRHQFNGTFFTNSEEALNYLMKKYEENENEIITH